jgi:Putative motility protein
MDLVTQIAAVATSLTQAQQASDKDISVEKKALDFQKTEAEGLIAAIPQPPTTATLGQTINTTA